MAKKSKKSSAPKRTARASKPTNTGLPQGVAAKRVGTYGKGKSGPIGDLLR